MGSKHPTMHDLILHQLKDLYYAERHMAKVLPKMAKAARSDTLRTALEQRHETVAVHVDRLEAVFAALDKKPHGVPCEAMDGIIGETKSLIHEFDDSPAIDAGLVGAAEAMEHYCLARYGALARWAATEGLSAEVSPLQATHAEAGDALLRWASMAPDVAPAAPAASAPAEPLTLKAAALMGLG